MYHTHYLSLVKSANDAAVAYYLDNQSIMSDASYDSLYQQILAIEFQQGYAVPDSPTQRIGYSPNNAFMQITHSRKLYSLDNIFNNQDLTDWIMSLQRYFPITLDLEHKYDGLAVSAVYDSNTGLLVHAATRGDGTIGEDITSNFKTVYGCLFTAPKNVIEIRGEVVMPLTVFAKLNAKLITDGKKPFSNARNAAAGSFRQKDPNITASRNLVFIPYEYIAKKETLAVPATNVITSVVVKNKADIELLHQAILKAQGDAQDKNYLTDGIVIKINDPDLKSILGFTNRAPRWARAYKVNDVAVFSTLEDVTLQVGKTGKITPVAKIAPAIIDGVTVTSVNLYNFNEIERLDLHKGSLVKVTRAGSVIPKLRSANNFDTNRKLTPLNIDLVCPACGGEITNKHKSVDLYCLNVQCPGQEITRLLHFVSRDAMRIKYLGEVTIESLVKYFNVKKPSDLYALTYDQMRDMIGNGVASRIKFNLEQSKDVTLAKFIYALCIPGVGVTTATNLATAMPDLFIEVNWIDSINLANLLAIEDIGEKTALSIVEYFNNPENIIEVNKLLSAGITINRQLNKHKLSGLKFVITGSFDGVTRGDLIGEITKLGGSITGSVSTTTDYVLVGENPGNKLNEAKRLGVKIIDLDTYLAMLK